MNHHQIEKTAASMNIEIRNAVAISLNRSQYDTHENSGRLYCRARLLSAAYVTPSGKVHGIHPVRAGSVGRPSRGGKN